MINFIVTYKNQVILKSKWQHLPREGESIRIQGKLYLIKHIIHDVDAMNNHLGYEVIIDVV